MNHKFGTTLINNASHIPKESCVPIVAWLGLQYTLFPDSACGLSLRLLSTPLLIRIKKFAQVACSGVPYLFKKGNEMAVMETTVDCYLKATIKRYTKHFLSVKITNHN